MKVRELLELIKEEGWGEDEELCVRIYAKSAFSYHEEDDLHLSDEAWVGIVADFEKEYEGYDEVYDNINLAVMEKLEKGES